MPIPFIIPPFRILNSFTNITFLLLLAAGTVLGQKQDSVKKPVDSLGAKKFIPTGIRIGTDLIALAKTGYDKTYTGWEVNFDADFNRYYLAVDYGSWGRTFTPDSGAYSNDGRYWRAGVDFNFLKKDPDKNMFFFGLRYGHSSFSEKLEITTYDPRWGSGPRQFDYSGQRAHWFELTTGLRVKMYKFIWMGYTARFKFGLKIDESAEMLASDVPGYGRADKESYWGFNYQLFFRIPVMRGRALQTKAPAAK